MKALRPITVDFETEPIDDRPRYPPRPVGVAIMPRTGRAAEYYAFGHPTENNCSKAEAHAALAKAYLEAKETGCGLLFHNAKFDLDVAETHWGMRPPPWELIHDTTFLLFLDDPLAQDLELKPSAERILGMPPEEADRLRDWAIEHRLMPRTAKEYGRLICRMPGRLVGKYGKGDVLRTRRLFDRTHPAVLARGMGPAYDRERRLLLPLLAAEREGIRVDLPLLERDCATYRAALGDEGSPGIIDRWLMKKLKVKGLNVDSDEQLADALVSSGLADETKFLSTAKGKRSVSKKSLPLAVTDQKVLWALQYRSMLQTRLGTFLEPWRDQARETGGRAHTQWNQVKRTGFGARTGRISASRFMNAPVGVGTSQHDDSLMLAYRHPDFIAGIIDLPEVRKYVLPDKGHVWAKRDFAQQELRILAHFEDGVLLKAYRENPRLDVHQYAVELFKSQYGVDVSRTRTKTIGFSLLYGMGEGELAMRLMLDVATTKRLKAGYLQIFPGLKQLQADLKGRAARGEPYHTWGGREYYCEPPRFVKKRGRVVTFDYKMINYLIQGSAACVTKQAMVNYFDRFKDGRFRVAVHDEMDVSMPKGALKSEMRILKECMEDIQLDCALLTDGEVGPNWAHLKDYKD